MSGNTSGREALPTVGGMLLEGNLTPRARTTWDDFAFAVEVLEAYEPEDDDAGAVALATVAAFLRAEMERRGIEKFTRDLTAQLAKEGLDVKDPRILVKIRKIAREQWAARKT